MKGPSAAPDGCQAVGSSLPTHENLRPYADRVDAVSVAIARLIDPDSDYSGFYGFTMTSTG